MLLTKRLVKELFQTNASVLLIESGEDEDKPELCIRKVVALYGKFDEQGNHGGILTDVPVGGVGHFTYSQILGYCTGYRASVQELILMENNWSFNAHCAGRNGFIEKAASMLLDSVEIKNEKLTIRSLTHTSYWYKDNWYGNIHRFVKLNDAKRMAGKETGTSVTIFTSIHGKTQIKEIAKASGFCPP